MEQCIKIGRVNRLEDCFRRYYAEWQTYGGGLGRNEVNKHGLTFASRVFCMIGFMVKTKISTLETTSGSSFIASIVCFFFWIRIIDVFRGHCYNVVPVSTTCC